MNTTEFEALSRNAMYEYIKEHWPEDAKGKSRARREELIAVFVRHQPLESSEALKHAKATVHSPSAETLEDQMASDLTKVLDEEFTDHIKDQIHKLEVGQHGVERVIVSELSQKQVDAQLEDALTPEEARLHGHRAAKTEVDEVRVLSSPTTMEITVPPTTVRLPGELLRAITDYAQIPNINRKFRRIKHAKYVSLAKRLAPYNLNVDDVAADPGRYA